MRCPKCGKRMFTMCNACGMWVNDCTDKTNHKDKDWVCDSCGKRVHK